MSVRDVVQAAAGALGEATYVDDVFSTYLYTGNGSTQTITNGIDLAGEGGLVWVKNRTNPNGNNLTDTARGVDYYLSSNTTGASTYAPTYAVSAFNSNGFSLPSGNLTNNNNNYASWTFRKAPKFFDVVTWTGNGVSGRDINHGLKSTPGCIIIKQRSGTEAWPVYHRSLWVSGGAPNYGPYVRLNETTASFAASERVLGVGSTTFTIGNNAAVNSNGATYVAYLFAHNAGGFGDGGSENVISCGSFTTDGSGNAAVNLGYEAQWVLMKKSSGAESWMLFDSMRGLVATPAAGNYSKKLVPNLSNAEADGDECRVSSTGFNVGGVVGGATYIYIAIRRPMKPPSAGTEVFAPVAYTGDGSSPKSIPSGFIADAAWGRGRTDTFNWNQIDRLRGSPRLSSNLTDAEGTSVYGYPKWDTMNGFNGVDGGTDNSNFNQSSMGYVFDVFKRASGFFDVVCYTGTGVARTVNHNLTVAPELMIVKRRSALVNWAVYSATTGNTKYLVLNNNNAAATDATYWNSTTPTSTVFSLGSSATPNQNTQTYVAYLFASLPGISKVGSYTGTGTTLQVNCGFTSGARFVLIRRTDSSGDWYVWDSARGIVAGNDPYLLLNSTAAEVTNTDYVDTYSAGFEISSTAPAGINANGGSFIFLAIA